MHTEGNTIDNGEKPVPSRPDYERRMPYSIDKLGGKTDVHVSRRGGCGVSLERSSPHRLYDVKQQRMLKTRPCCDGNEESDVRHNHTSGVAT